MSLNSFVIEPRGGLANRLMSILSGLRLAHLYQRKFFVHWERGADCYADSDHLFKTRFRTPSFGSQDCDFHNVFVEGTGWTQSPAIPNNSPEKGIWVKTHTILVHPGESRENHFMISDPAAIEMSSYFNFMQPSDIVSEKLRKFDHIDFLRTIGIHIRRPYPATSPHHAAESKNFRLPTDEYYLDLISSLLEFGQFDNVFLCTNDFQTERIIREKFGDKILVAKKTSIDNGADPEAVQDALVDMMLLSKCASVVRYNRSSFSYLAMCLGLRPNLTLSQGDSDLSPRIAFHCFLPNQKFIYKDTGMKIADALSILNSNLSIRSALAD